MDKFMVHGGKPLRGEVTISGSKNAGLPIMAASLLTEEDVILRNVPQLNDIKTMMILLEHLGKKIEMIDSNTIRISEVKSEEYEAPYEIVRKMRASIAVMGPLLGRKRQAKISFPGGCAIGPRPVDLHIKGMEELGTQIRIQHGYIWAQAKELIGKKIYLQGSNGPSVLATENVMMAATLAKGTTVIEGAAEEPEVKDLADCLNKMGAKISGAGTSIIIIDGVERLHQVDHTVIPDRIETGTFIAAAGITRGEVRLKNVNIEHIGMPIKKFSEAGVEIEILSATEIIARCQTIKSVDVDTKPFPLYPTDLQAQLMALVTLGNGISVITENIFPERFNHAAELNRMGANIRIEKFSAIIKGVEYLSGASVMASDLRAGAGLVVATLAARGLSEVLRVYHIDRGYDHFEEKLRALGADIERAHEN